MKKAFLVVAATGKNTHCIVNAFTSKDDAIKRSEKVSNVQVVEIEVLESYEEWLKWAIVGLDEKNETPTPT